MQELVEERLKEDHRPPEDIYETHTTLKREYNRNLAAARKSEGIIDLQREDVKRERAEKETQQIERLVNEKKATTYVRIISPSDHSSIRLHNPAQSILCVRQSKNRRNILGQ